MVNGSGICGGWVNGSDGGGGDGVNGSGDWVSGSGGMVRQKR